MPTVDERAPGRPSAHARPGRLSACLWAVWLASGCAHGSIHYGSGSVEALSAFGKPTKRARGKAPSGPPVAGTWDWIFRASDEAGNLRVEQEEWHLDQQGAALSGYYDRAVTMLSTDDRLFRCNQQLGYTRFTRVKLAGEIGGDGRVRLREVEYRTLPGPCDDGARILVTYEGEVGPATMRLWFSEQRGQQTLHRRDPAATTGPTLARTVGFEEATQPASTTAHPPAQAAPRQPPLTGVWQWEMRSIDGDGDERDEHEEWDLVEEDGAISGTYRRSVTRRREGSVYSCNGLARYETSTRYEVRGHRFGDALTLTETAYHAAADPCDNGLRHLDVYQGALGPGGELVLTFGAGNQVLRRRRAP